MQSRYERSKLGESQMLSRVRGDRSMMGAQGEGNLYKDRKDRKKLLDEIKELEAKRAGNCKQLKFLGQQIQTRHDDIKVLKSRLAIESNELSLQGEKI